MHYLLPHLGWIAARAPNRVNRAHGPTKENNQNFCIFRFFRPTQKMGPDGPKWAQEDFFLLIQTLPTFWAERIWILRIFIFCIFLGPKFLAWAQLGPTHLGPARAHPLGPGWGPRVGRGVGWVGRVGPSGRPSGGPGGRSPRVAPRFGHIAAPLGLAASLVRERPSDAYPTIARDSAHTRTILQPNEVMVKNRR